MNNIQKFLEELRQLDLPIGEYVIVSSGSMAIRGIRECSDLDLLVSDSLFESLSQKYSVVTTPTISKIAIGNIECLHIKKSPDDLYPTDRQIKEANMVDGFPFQNLETCLYFKEKEGREKDLRDVELIREYMKNKNSD
jgi:hypothetical protein